MKLADILKRLRPSSRLTTISGTWTAAQLRRGHDIAGWLPLTQQDLAVEKLRNAHLAIFRANQDRSHGALVALETHAVSGKRQCPACTAFDGYGPAPNAEARWPPRMSIVVRFQDGECTYDLRRQGPLFVCQACDDLILRTDGFPIGDGTLYAQPTYVHHALYAHSRRCASPGDTRGRHFDGTMRRRARFGTSEIKRGSE